MKFSAVEFHTKRHRSILARRPEIRELMGTDIWTAVFMAVFFVANIFCTFVSSKLSVLEVVVLAATIGAFLKVQGFGHGHELCHGLVHPKIKGGLKTALLMLIQLPSFISYFRYYQWFHLSHHRQLGSQAFDEALSLALNFGEADGDALAFIRESSYRKNKTATALTVQPLRRSLIGRILFYGLYYQLANLFFFSVGYTVFLFPTLFRLITKWNSLEKDYRKNLLIMILEQALFILSLTFIGVFWGWKSLLYLALSALFSRGFLFHPYLSYFVMNHRSYEFDDGTFQPTSSTYGPVMSFLCGGGNCHLEHHDFPNIPASRLDQVRKIAPESYVDIPHFKGVLDVLRQLVKSKGEDWIYASQNRAFRE